MTGTRRVNRDTGRGGCEPVLPEATRKSTREKSLQEALGHSLLPVT